MEQISQSHRLHLYYPLNTRAGLSLMPEKKRWSRSVVRVVHCALSAVERAVPWSDADLVCGIEHNPPTFDFQRSARFLEWLLVVIPRDAYFASRNSSSMSTSEKEEEEKEVYIESRSTL